MTTLSFLKHSWNYLSAQIANKGLAFISIPIFTRLLTPGEYGILNVLGSISTLIVPFITLNCSISLGRYYFDTEKTDFNSFFTTTLVLCFTPLLLCFGLSIFFIDEIAHITDLPLLAIPFLLPASILWFINHLALILLRSEKRSSELRRFSISRGYAGFVLAVVIMYFLEENVYLGRLWANVIILVSSFSWLAWKFKSYISLDFKKEHLKYMLSYGLPLLPANISAVLLMDIDRIMLNSMKGAGEAGLYSFAYNISMLLLMFSNALQYAFVPDYYSLMNKGEPKKVDDSFKLISVLVSVAAVFLILFGSYIGMILGSKSYWSSLSLIPLIVIGQYFLTFVPLYKQGISFAKKTIYSSISVVVAGGVNVTLNAIFIPHYGAVAGAVSTIIAYIVQFGIVYYTVKHVLNLPCFEIRHLVKIVFQVMIAVAGYYALVIISLDLWLDILLRVFLASVLALTLIKPYHNQLIKVVRKYV